MVKVGKDCVVIIESGVSLAVLLGLEGLIHVLSCSCLCSVEL